MILVRKLELHNEMKSMEKNNLRYHPWWIHECFYLTPWSLPFFLFTLFFSRELLSGNVLSYIYTRLSTDILCNSSSPIFTWLFSLWCLTLNSTRLSVLPLIFALTIFGFEANLVILNQNICDTHTPGKSESDHS
jgi:hypothetical protein